MAQVNGRTKTEPLRTHEGGIAKRINSEQMLRRSVMSCMLWENEFYEDGVTIADRIAELVKHVNQETVMNLAMEARNKGNLRHVPLLLLRESVRNGGSIANALENVIQRPDELAEFLAIYWKDGKTPVAAQVKKGLAKAFPKFNAYQLAKYNRDRDIMLRDVLFICHAKPNSAEQAETWKKLVDGTLESADTWEKNLSAGEDKKTTWERLITENKLGAMALLRNLRNMLKVGVNVDYIKAGLKTMKTDKVLPFRFITAEKYAPSLSDSLEEAMLRSLGEYEKVKGKTILLIDSSGSMCQLISDKSELTKLDAANALAILAREIFEDVRIFAFSTKDFRKSYIEEIPTRHGFAIRDKINAMYHGGTYLGEAVKKMNEIGYERIVVFTDEQSADTVPTPVGDKNYMINVASNVNGVGYGKWNHINGFSEATIDYIIELEKNFSEPKEDCEKIQNLL